MNSHFFWLSLNLVCLMILLMATGAEGATFHYQFNNVEQGPGSTSHSTIIVGAPGTQKPKARQQELEPELEPELEAEPMPEMMAVPRLEREVRPEKWSRPWAASIGASALVHEKKVSGASLRLGYSVLRDLAVAVLAGVRSGKTWEAGSELEITPLRLSTFGWSDWIEASFLLGGTRWVGDELPPWVFAHGGVRVQLNMGERIGWNVALRTNLTDRSRDYRQLEGGMHVRF
jgi:hypothetical protein